MRSLLGSLAIVIYLLTPAPSVAAGPQDAEHHENVERFLSNLQLEEGFRSIRGIFAYQRIGELLAPYADLSDDAKSVVDHALVEAIDTYGAEELAREMYDVVSTMIPAEELPAINAFLETPIGSKIAPTLHGIPLKPMILSPEEGDEINAFRSTSAGMRLSETVELLQTIARAEVDRIRRNFLPFAKALIATRLREANHID